MTKILLLSAFFFCVALSCSAQIDSDEALAGTLHALRNWFFTYDKPGVEELKGLVEQMDAKEVTNSDQSMFLLNAWYAYAVNKQSIKNDACPKAMKKADIIQIFEDDGFLLTGDSSNEQSYILKFQK